MNTVSKKIVLFLVAFASLWMYIQPVQAQIRVIPDEDTVVVEESTDEAELASESAEASAAAQEREKLDAIKKEDVTRPEEAEEKAEFLALFAQRPANEITFLNFFAYGIQYAVSVGIPANTIMLILLLPLLATIIAFVRHVIGLPSLGMLVPIALSITLISTGLAAGIVLLAAIIFGSTLAKIILKKVRIMQLPKMALSMFIVSITIFIALTASATAGIIVVKQISIFPVLLLILLSENIVTLQLERSTKETLMITGVTLLLGVLGYLVLSWEFLRKMVLLYPEIVLLLIPLNIVIGRYFGLRFTEFLRFAPINRHGSK